MNIFKIIPKNIFMNVLKRVLFYLSSFIPLYFLIIIKELIDIVNGNLSFNITNSVMLILNLIFILLGVIGVVLYYGEKTEKVEIIKIKNITREDFLPYFPLFVLFALAFELEFVSMAVVYIIILAMVGVVYIKNDMNYINPFLNIVGFKTFEIEYRNEKGCVETKKVFSQKNNFIFVNDLFGK